MKKILPIILFLCLFLLSTSSAFGQSKLGVNIAANHGDFQKAVDLVGPGGWVVVMVCPSDGDKITEWVQKYPQVNLVIRGHFAGQNPDENLAKLWTATLSSIVTPNKIYFMPWNEPNHENEGGGPTSRDGQKSYDYSIHLQQLFQQAGILDSKIILLSPMVDKLNPSFTGSFFNTVGKNNYYGTFSGSSINEYDQTSGTKPYEACKNNWNEGNNCRYDQIGIQGPYYALETGVAGTSSDGQPQPVYKDNEIINMLNKSWEKWGTDYNFKMFAILSYDPHRTGSWDIFNSSQTKAFYSSHRQGPCCTKPSTSSTSSPSFAVNKCPGKNHTFWLQSESECSECGGSTTLLSCKPQQGLDFGEEYSPQQIKINEIVNNPREALNACYIREFTAKTSAEDTLIPFAYELNQYFLGPYVDNLGARTAKQNPDPVKDYGVFEKLAPKELQDRLKTEFLDFVMSGNSRYQNFSIQGMPASLIKSTHERLNRKPLSEESLKFEKNIWAQVPLFANEESEGEIIFEGVGITGSLKTSVPEVYRLNKVTSWIAQMLGIPEREIQGVTTQSSQVLAACATEQNPPSPATKESQSGPSSNVCAKDEIQIKTEDNLQGIRHFDESIFEAKDTGDCDQKIPGSCCDKKGKCVGNVDPVLGVCAHGSCYCQSCGDTDSCFGQDESGCKVIESEHKFDTAINVKNRVPFLARIAENTVGESGFFRLFIPAATDTTKRVNNEFREVAGESPATITLSDFKEKTPPIRVTAASENNLISLLFHKMGTMINVKDLVSGIVLWPYKALAEFTDSPAGTATLTYTIDFRNPAVSVSAANKNTVIDMVKNSWPNTKINSQWDYVYSEAKKNGWNPAFVIALWIEESGASGVTFRTDLNREVWDLGCTAGKPNNLASQLDCLFNKAVNRDSTFENFMCSYSEGQNAPCTFDNNPNFTRNLKIWYNRLTQ